MAQPRSYLYVPGNQPDRLARAASRGADALIADLEDSVPDSAKDYARSEVARWLSTSPQSEVQRWVRITSTTPAADVNAITTHGLTGVVVSKATPSLLTEVDRLLSTQEAKLGLTAGTIRVFGLIETAAGLLTAADCARHPRVDHLGLGEVDLTAELRISTGPGSPEVKALRLQIVIACAAAETAPPVAPTSRDFRDLDALRSSTSALRASGFGARTAIHPAQLAVINDVFSPTDHEVAAAKRLIAAFETSRADGRGTFTDDNGLMVDAAVVRAAMETLARASGTARGLGE